MPAMQKAATGRADLAARALTDALAEASWMCRQGSGSLKPSQLMALALKIEARSLQSQQQNQSHCEDREALTPYELSIFIPPRVPMLAAKETER